MLKASQPLAVVGAIGFTFLASGAPRAAQTPQPSSPQDSDSRAVINKYCVSCHNERAKTAGLMLDKVNDADPGSSAEIWEKVVRKVRVGMMPPLSLIPIRGARCSVD